MVDALFPYTRRVGRWEYAVRLLACLLVSVPILAWRWHVVRAHQANEALLFLAVLVLALVVIQAQLIARLRDIHASILLSGLVFVPYVNAALAFGLLFVPSRVPAPVHSESAGPPMSPM